MNRSTVVISRRWSGPMIKIDVRRTGPDTGVEVSMSLAEFLQALVQEIGNPALIMRQAALLAAANDAADRVCAGMKSETTRVM